LGFSASSLPVSYPSPIGDARKWLTDNNDTVIKKEIAPKGEADS
jgi:hypothetical protein